MKPRSLLASLALAGIGAAVAARARGAAESFSFAHKVVLITGGSRGLGLVLARMLAEEGAKVAILARDEAELERAADDIRGHGGEALTLASDVGNQSQAEEAVGQVVAKWGRLDVLINDAGLIQVGPWDQMTVGDFEAAMAVHMWGPLYSMLAVVPQMRRQGEGRIVNISSVGGKIAVPHLLPYSASKFALVGLSDGMRAELGRENIHVTTVAPGLMRTGSPVQALFKGQHEKEYGWFVVLGSLPITSVSAEAAARRIIEATRSKKAALTIGIQARAAILASTRFPELFARSMQLFSMLLPKPGGADGDHAQTGRESESEVSRSVLARPTYEAAQENNELEGTSARRAQDNDDEDYRLA